METKAALQERWNYLYKDYLPMLAKARDEAQPKWPVVLDHCFARIILDKSVGVDRPWSEVLKSPAYKNMSETQLQTAIALAEKIAQGNANLVELDERSLQLRGKQSKKRKGRGDAANEANTKDGSLKKKRKDETVSSYFLPSPDSTSAKTADANDENAESGLTTGSTEKDADMSVQAQRIKDSNMTSFRKQILTMLTRIPRGSYSTYGAISDHLSKSSKKTCARAVGSAIKNNPFAPEVPCHRILAADGTLGGFKSGGWGESGTYANEKHLLLKEEGVKFDSNMKVKGPPFRDFST